MTAIQPKTDASTITVCNPADGRVVGTVPIETPEAVAWIVELLRFLEYYVPGLREHHPYRGRNCSASAR